jgi:hypothetical protein
MSSYTNTWPELLYELPAPVIKNNYTAQAVISAAASTSVPRCIIPANYFSQVGKALKIMAAGTVGGGAGTATFAFAGGLDVAAGTIGGVGGATLFTTGTITPATGTSNWDLTGDITCQAVGNAGTTIQFNGAVRVSGTTANAFGTAYNAAILSNSLTALNNEISLFLELWGTWSVASSSNTTTLQQFKVYGEN